MVKPEGCGGQQCIFNVFLSKQVGVNENLGVERHQWVNPPPPRQIEHFLVLISYHCIVRFHSLHSYSMIGFIGFDDNCIVKVFFKFIRHAYKLIFTELGHSF